ncbi:MAG: 50S ribosomal protein L32 [Tepidisphaeraceae bacterium]|jgi:large subunit ribosomal protein L32
MTIDPSLTEPPFTNTLAIHARRVSSRRGFLLENSRMQPVMKISKSRKRKRRSHHALRPIHYVRCPQCSNAKLPHCACDNCGYVNPKLALQMETEQA